MWTKRNLREFREEGGKETRPTESGPAPATNNPRAAFFCVAAVCPEPSPYFADSRVGCRLNFPMLRLEVDLRCGAERVR